MVLGLRLHSDSPPQFQHGWDKLLADITNGDTVEVCSMWLKELENCEIGTHEDRQLLRRCEGGIGGDCNRTCRQMRFSSFQTPWLNYNDLVLGVMPSDDANSTWTTEEAWGFGEALQRTLSRMLGSGGICVDLYLKLDGDFQR